MGRRAFGRVRRLTSGRWQARYQAADGTDTPAPFTFATKTAAARWLDAVEVDLRRGVGLDHRTAERTTLAEYSDGWVATHAEARRLTVMTAAGYQSLLDSCILTRTVDGMEQGLGGLPVGQLRQTDVKRWQAALARDGLSSARRLRALRVLSMVCDDAVDDQLLPANPCDRVPRPSQTAADPQVLTPEQVAAIVREADQATGLMVLLMAYCGLRLGEVLALRRRCLVGEVLTVTESVGEPGGRQVLSDTKTHQQRRVPVPASLAARLTVHGADMLPGAWLFPSRAGTPLRYKTVRRRFDHACEAAGVSGVTPHDLRATCGSWVAQSHGVLEAARRLGHSAASVTTRHYARPLAGGDERVASDLDEQLRGTDVESAQRGSGTGRARNGRGTRLHPL